jgi:hypothetical protein
LLASISNLVPSAPGAQATDFVKFIPTTDLLHVVFSWCSQLYNFSLFFLATKMKIFRSFLAAGYRWKMFCIRMIVPRTMQRQKILQSLFFSSPVARTGFILRTMASGIRHRLRGHRKQNLSHLGLIALKKSN